MWVFKLTSVYLQLKSQVLELTGPKIQLSVLFEKSGAIVRMPRKRRIIVENEIVFLFLLLLF